MFLCRANFCIIYNWANITKFVNLIFIIANPYLLWAGYFLLVFIWRIYNSRSILLPHFLQNNAPELIFAPHTWQFMRAVAISKIMPALLSWKNLTSASCQLINKNCRLKHSDMAKSTKHNIILSIFSFFKLSTSL